MGQRNQITKSDYLEYGEFENLLGKFNYNKEYIWELYARLSFCTALRSSDVLSIKWNMILDKDNLVICEQKTKKVRDIRFNDSVKSKFKELYYLLGSPDENQLCFYNRSTKKHISIQYINQKLKSFKFGYHLNIGNFSTHTFRKTFGRYVYEQMGKTAESLILLNQIFNHSSLSTTQIYIGIRKNEIDNIFNSIQF